ncbi:MAG: VWA domain-containing protein [Planctomycetota bacterium]|nr:VWA domain-containing protein [Planctomycetota bacterium]MDA1162385.1 VWA domain-containing protein [Planctomycetota bacterium]
MSAHLRIAVGVVVIVLTSCLSTGCGLQSTPESSDAITTLGSPKAPAAAESVRRDVVAKNRHDFAGESAPDDDRAEPVAQDETSPQQMLTAGLLDDAERISEFRNYVAATQQSADGRHADPLDRWSGRRFKIMVRNHQGQPVQDAIVRIFPGSKSDRLIQLKYQPDVEDSESPVLVASLRTGSDGCTHFLPGIDGDTQGDLWNVEIATPDGQLRVRQEGLTETVSSWDFAIGNVPSELPAQLDLALVIDTTGSMGDELEYLKQEISRIVARTEQLFPNVRQRFALILYRDDGDRYVTRNFDFTDSLTEFQRTLSAQHAGGGGDYPEAMHAALEQASELSWQDRNTARMVFLVGDAPPHGRHLQRTFDAVQKLRQRDVAIFPIAGSGTRDEAEFTLRTAAFLTMGKYLFLTDHSGIGLPHAAPHAPSYNVEWLSSVMLRMIASELTGRELLPAEILATEDSGTTLLSQPQPEPRLQPQAATTNLAIPHFTGALWDEIRPLVALALLLLLAMGERLFSRRPVPRQQR